MLKRKVCLKMVPIKLQEKGFQTLLIRKSYIACHVVLR